MILQAEALNRSGAKAALVKGGHGDGDECADLLYDGASSTWFRSKRIDTKNTHGTGCSLSSAIAAFLAHGQSLSSAVEKSKHWITGAIATSDQLDVGQGSGPVHHFHDLWSK